MPARVAVNETPNKNTKLNRGDERYGSVSALLTVNAAGSSVECACVNECHLLT